MPANARQTPFDGTERLIIDGTNLLYRLGAGAGGPAPASAIVGRIRAAVPMPIAIDLVFDGVGHGVYGRLAQKMAVRYSGRQSADDTILDLVSEAALRGGGPAATDRVLVVTNDRALRDLLAAKGARTAPLQWLIAKLDVPAPAPRPAASGGGPARATSIGQGRPPGGHPSGGGHDRPAWKPGRGATAKTGTPRKVARHKRHPRALG
jgi:rRNA-processing protein FCF1